MTTPTRDDIQNIFNTTRAFRRQGTEEGGWYVRDEEMLSIRTYITHLEQSLESAEREAFEAARKQKIVPRDGINLVMSAYGTFDDYKKTKGE